MVFSFYGLFLKRNVQGLDWFRRPQDLPVQMVCYLARFASMYVPWRLSCARMRVLLFSSVPMADGFWCDAGRFSYTPVIWFGSRLAVRLLPL
ncbi:hypothetical protein AO070_12770 [Pseudomonas syringae pv. syringae PD2766]|nr:hypothetical protein AO070_12770 [Pseudomonas syringae pv. syringae PD2766]